MVLEYGSQLMEALAYKMDAFRAAVWKKTFVKEAFGEEALL